MPTMYWGCGNYPVTQTASQAQTAIAYPVCNPGEQEFRQLDSNQDNRVSFAEFCEGGPFYPTPIPLPLDDSAPVVAAQ